MPKVAQLPPLTPRELRAAAKASRERNDGRALLSIDDAALYLRMSRRTVYNAIRAGKIRAVMVEGTLRIRPSDLDAYVEARFVS